MLLPPLLYLYLTILTAGVVQAVPKTSIFIDQIPLYSSLPSCAEDQLSTIVRAQYSGCGDDMQLTSFSCFCLDSSAYVWSVFFTYYGLSG
jgi:hypothetical protein